MGRRGERKMVRVIGGRIGREKLNSNCKSQNLSGGK